MARLSIYLPDDIEARVRAVQPDTPTSQVIRAALERYLGDDDGPGYAQRPDDADDLLAAGITHLLDAARADYQDGYRAALRRLPVLDWHALDSFASSGYDLDRWLAGYRSTMDRDIANDELGARTSDWVVELADDVGEPLNAPGYDKWNFTRTVPWLRGYGDGLRAAHQAALRGTPRPADSTASDTPTPPG